MLTDAQIKERESGIGGSDLAAILGMDPWKDRPDVFFQKRPDLAKEAGYQPAVIEGDNIDLGNLFEDPVASMYMRKTGKKVRNRYQTIVSKKYPWLRANVDRIVVGERRGVEIKTASGMVGEKWGPSGSNEFPDWYRCQLWHYLTTTEYPAWDLAALIGFSGEVRIYHEEADADVSEMVVDLTRDFWENHVKTGVVPDPDPNHKRASDVIARLYPQPDKFEIDLPYDYLHWHEVWTQANDMAKQYADTAKVAQNHIKIAAKKAGVIRIAGVPGAWIHETRKRGAYSVEASEYNVFRYSSRKK